MYYYSIFLFIQKYIIYEANKFTCLHYPYLLFYSY